MHPVRERIHHPAAEALDLPTVMRTLGDPSRLEIVRELAGRRPGTHVRRHLGRRRPAASTCSYHLRLLREAGVTRTRAEGTQRPISCAASDLEQRFPGLVEVLVGAE